MQDSIFETGLPQTPANYAALSPLSFIARAAHVYPEQTAVIHGERSAYCMGVTLVAGITPGTSSACFCTSVSGTKACCM